jgi:hypothetical protein
MFLRDPRSSVTTILIPAIATALLAGCTALYSPNTIPTPLLEHRGDVSTAVHFGPAGVEVQAAGAVVDGIALGGSFAYKNPVWMGSRARENYGEGDLSYSMRLAPAVMLNLLAGGGGGISGIPYGRDSQTSFNRLFLQGTLGLGNALRPDSGTADGVAWGVMLRLSRAAFSASSIERKPVTFETGYFIEPGLFLRTYSGNIGVGFQIAGVKALNGALSYTYPSFAMAVSFFGRFSLSGESGERAYADEGTPPIDE